MPGTLQQAIAAVKAGDKAEGRRLLAAVLRDDPRSEAAWLWMSAVIDSDEQRRACLKRVLAINPNNQTAYKGLARLGPVPQPLVAPSPEVPSRPAGTPSPGVAPAASSTPPLAGPARMAKAALPGWSLLIAFGATIVVCAAIGIAAYLALTGALGVLRQLARLTGRCKKNAV